MYGMEKVIFNTIVRYRSPDTGRKHSNRRRRGLSDSGQFFQNRRISRKLAAIFTDDNLGAFMKIPRSGIISETAPVLHDLIKRTNRQGENIRKRLQKTQIIWNDRCDLCLLQHYLGQPDPVSIPRILPGERMTPMPFLPRNQCFGKRSIRTI